MNLRKTISGLFLIIPVLIFSQTTSSANAEPTSFSFPSVDPNTVLFVIAATLGLVLIIFAGLLRSAIKFHFNTGKIKDGIKYILIGFILSAGCQVATAQETIAPTAKNIHFGLSPMGWFMAVIIILEIYIMLSMIRWLKYFTGIAKYESSLPKSVVNLWDKINAFKPMEKEASIDTGHDYDGIRELDNVTPPWFTAAFAGTIIFAIIYLYRYHLVDSPPTQLKEYAAAVKEAELQKMEALKHQANQVDENTVTLLKEGQFEEGKMIYKTACAVCHGNEGQGLVGPNMTDDYWIHGGGVKEIFSTIKYGVLDKGMKSWKEDYSPNQIAQLTSYIKSMRGTNPPNPKGPQGELYKEVQDTNLTTNIKTAPDSLNAKK